MRNPSSLPQLREVVHDPTLLQVVGDHSTAGRQAGFYVGLHAQAALYCLFCKKSWEKSILSFVTVSSNRNAPLRLTHLSKSHDDPRHKRSSAHPPAPSMTDGLLVLVQLVMAAMTTEPWLNVYSFPLNWKGTSVLWRSGVTWKPLKPCYKCDGTK